MKNGKTVLVHMGRWRFVRQRLAGIYRYARKHNWTVNLVEPISDNVSVSWKDAIDLWKPDGVIIDGDDVRVPSSLKGVTVHCDADPHVLRARHYGVKYDSNAAAVRVVDELLSLNLPHYAYVGYYTKIDWSRQRLKTFRERLGDRYDPKLVFKDGSGNAMDHLRHLQDWVSTLPRPCGIFVVNDGIARLLAACCKSLGIAVPDEIAIASIDNDEVLCEGEEPTLTSATQNFEESGYRAAEMLDALMRGETVDPPVWTLSEAVLVRRQSTRKFQAGNACYRAAVDFIRENACAGIGVPEVLQFLDSTRRKAERGFKAFTGRTILAEIQEVRFAKACMLLKNPKMSLDEIFQFCGFRDNTAFRRFFQSRAGVPLGEWRKAHS